MKYKLLLGFWGAAIGLLMVEVLLRLFDPYAYQVRYDGLDMFHNHVIEHEYGYIAEPGHYEYRHWSITIQDDNTRLVPDTRQTDCEIVMLGDSVMFGYGISDNETLPNYLAQQFPDATFINTALSGYNSTNIRRIYEAYSAANGFIYLIVDNDAGDTFALSEVQLDPQLPFASWYFFAMRGRLREGVSQYAAFEPSPAQQARFMQDTAPLFDDPRVLTATYGDIPYTNDLPVDVRLAIPDERIAPGDMHPNGDGNRELAAALAPYVARLINEVCHEQR